MDELNFTGNCLKGSRPVLSFDSAFDKDPHYRVIKELFLHIFGVPEGARKSKPFVDHVMGFSIADGKIWVRNYQINEVEKTKGEDGEDGEAKKEKKSSRKPDAKDTDINLVEIGPRFVLTPVVIQEGAFGGPIIYENKQFVSPNQVRADLRRKKADRHQMRSGQQADLMAKKDGLGLRTEGSKKQREDELDTRKIFA